MNKVFSLCKIILYMTLLSAFIIMCLIMSAGQTIAAGKYKEVEEFTDFLNHRIPALMESYAIPGVAIALIHEGEVAWLKAYGYADLEEERLMTTDTICRVQSISKSLTAWGIMKLVEEGQIKLDTPALEYLGDWRFPPSEYQTDAITVRQLLSLSAGMPLGDVLAMYSPTEETPSLEDALFKDAVAIKEPGSAFYYSNVSINLLELIIENVTGRDFAEYMAEEVLLPLGMTQSSFNWSNDFNPSVPVGYNLSGNPKSVYIYPEKASGGLFASARDIAQFVVAGMTGRYSKNHGVLEADTIELLYQPEVNITGFYALAFNAYGLGHLIEYLPGGTLAVSHGGAGQRGDEPLSLNPGRRCWYRNPH